MAHFGEQIASISIQQQRKIKGIVKQGMISGKAIKQYS
jgi:hypothetical protein